MKFIHLSDLHIGKSLGPFRLLEDQKFILDQITDIIKSERPHAVLISGDIYDRGVPPIEAVELLNKFIENLSQIKSADNQNMQTFIISGNHDSSERLAFCRSLISQQGIHFSPVYNGNIKPFMLNDEYGEVFVYMLPYIKPMNVRESLKDYYLKNNLEIDSDCINKISSYTDAVQKAIELMRIDTSKRNVLLSHQSVGTPIFCDSETVNIGGSPSVDPEAYKDFNYVALGHIHTPQYVDSNNNPQNVLYYSGTPLKYSFSEEHVNKSVAVVDIDCSGNVSVKKIPLNPLHDLRTISKSFDEIMTDEPKSDDYVSIILSDDSVSSYYYDELCSKFSRIVNYDTRNSYKPVDNKIGTDIEENQSELDIFSGFFEIMNERPMNDEEFQYMSSLIEDIISQNAQN